MALATYFFLTFKKIAIKSAATYIANQVILGLARGTMSSFLNPKRFNDPLLSYNERMCNEKNKIGNNNTAEKNIETIFILKSNKVRLQQFNIFFRIITDEFIYHEFIYLC
jgi:hypothetical protein